MRNTVLVVGASSKIGRACVKRFLEAGYGVLGTYNNNKPDTQHERYTDFKWDCGLANAGVRLAEEASSVDSIVYCAGLETSDLAVVDFPHSAYTMMQVNALTFFELVKATAQRENSGLRTASIALDVFDLKGHRSAGRAIYKASKACARSLMISLAVALAPNVRVNGVEIGACDDRLPPGDYMTVYGEYIHRCPMRRMGLVEEAADAFFALTETLTYSTGSVITVDGGRSLR